MVFLWILTSFSTFSISVDQGLVYTNLSVKPSLPPDFVYAVLLEQNHTHLFAYHI